MNTHLSQTQDILLSIETHLRQVIRGQDAAIRMLIIAYFAGGHVLIEGAPGLGKTRLIKSFARCLGTDSKRISFTPDLIPSDLIGGEIYRPKDGTFEIRKGPIFTSILLADEINRTPPKVQSALLEAMEERCVTIGTTTLELPHPFFVVATENPIEHDGTYPLPEAQLDRFLMRIDLDHPSLHDEISILRGDIGDEKEPTGIIEQESLSEIQDYIEESISIQDHLYEYIARIIRETRIPHPSITHGVSTRAGLALVRTAKVRALLEGREFILPEDIKSLAPLILAHRIRLNYSAEVRGERSRDIIHELIAKIEIE